MKIGRRGFTLLETVISLGLFLMILSIAFVTWFHSYKNYHKLETRMELRQQLRFAGDRISDDIKNASYVFAGRNAIIEGNSYEVPKFEESGTDLIMAIPENALVGNLTYTIIAYRLEKNDSDESNTDAYDLVRYEASGIVPETVDTPATINLDAISGGQEKIVSRYVDASRFQFIIKDLGKSVEVKPLATKRADAREQFYTDSFNVVQNIRNR
ncbi:MAG: PilW family protein [Vulcanimicrobiota bacterium]